MGSFLTVCMYPPLHVEKNASCFCCFFPWSSPLMHVKLPNPDFTRDRWALTRSGSRGVLEITRVMWVWKGVMTLARDRGRCPLVYVYGNARLFGPNWSGVPHDLSEAQNIDYALSSFDCKKAPSRMRKKKEKNIAHCFWSSLYEIHKSSTIVWLWKHSVTKQTCPINPQSFQASIEHWFDISVLQLIQSCPSWCNTWRNPCLETETPFF